MHMPTCPNGHTSADADYCDECGAAIGGAAASSGAATAVATEEPAAPATQTCPQCGATRTGRFCEVDGYDFVAADLRGDQPATGAGGSGTEAGSATTAPAGPSPSGPAGDDAPTGTAAEGDAPDAPDAGTAGGSGPTGTDPDPADPASDGAGTESAGSESAGPNGAGTDGAGTDGAGTGGAGSDSAGSDRAGSDRAGSNGAGAGGAGSAGADGAAAGTRWRLAVRADHDYHLRVLAMNGPDAEQMEFPKFAPERQFALQDDQVLVGRASRSRGIEPQIDLTGPPEDPGVSRSHAMLVHGADGWSVVDLDSANGTYLNDSDEPIAANQPVPLRDGDRIHVGAWTTLQLITA